jgi:hypothetical protein
MDEVPYAVEEGDEPVMVRLDLEALERLLKPKVLKNSKKRLNLMKRSNSTKRFLTRLLKS